jgi:outer membrane immunogenic protein
MRRVPAIVAVLSLWSAAGPAWAADAPPVRSAPAKAVPYVAPLYDWTGFYVGAHGGAGWADSTLRDPTGATFAPPGAGVNISGNGWLGGAQLGYNYQLDAWVFGIEGDLSYTDIRGSTTSPFGVTLNNRLNWVSTVTGRLGIAWDRTLIYAKAGAAFGETSYAAQVPLVVDFRGKDTRAGWTVGAGAEYAIWENLSVKAEYNYIDLGTRTLTATTPAGGSTPIDAKTAEHTIKFGANYRFGW